MRRRLELIWALVKNQFRHDTAYLRNTILSVGTPLVYNIVFIVFLEVLFKNVTSIGGFTRSEIFLLMLMSQASFYLVERVFLSSAMHTAESINKGKFDYVLLRPQPARMMAFFSKPSLLQVVANTIPTTALYSLLINWSAIDISLHTAAWAVPVFLVGTALMTQFVVLCTVPAFWVGESRSFVNLYYMTPSHPFTLANMPSWMKVTTFSVLPDYFKSAVVAGVLLGKLSGLHMLIYGLVGLCFMYALTTVLWKKGLNSYASASS